MEPHASFPMVASHVSPLALLLVSCQNIDGHSLCPFSINRRPSNTCISIAGARHATANDPQAAHPSPPALARGRGILVTANTPARSCFALPSPKRKVTTTEAFHPGRPGPETRQPQPSKRAAIVPSRRQSRAPSPTLRGASYFITRCVSFEFFFAVSATVRAGDS